MTTDKNLKPRKVAAGRFNISKNGQKRRFSPLKFKQLMPLFFDLMDLSSFIKANPIALGIKPSV